MFLIYFIVLRWRALCRNDHRTQNQSLKQVFYDKFIVWKSCHFGRHFKKPSKQAERCIARTNRYRALHESAFFMQLTPGDLDLCCALQWLLTHCMLMFGISSNIRPTTTKPCIVLYLIALAWQVPWPGDLDLYLTHFTLLFDNSSTIRPTTTIACIVLLLDVLN